MVFSLIEEIDRDSWIDLTGEKPLVTSLTKDVHQNIIGEHDSGTRKGIIICRDIQEAMKIYKLEAYDR